MTHTPHGLAKEFPALVDTIHILKQTDPQYLALYDSYDEVNHAVHLAETNLLPADDSHIDRLRRRRMVLKDRIYAKLTRHAGSPSA